ncbi:MAG: ComEC/Rec2 family competence protein [Spirochaetes bacterium]|nr:ComEC/Rec2 family competence protein [Spirochaetota bacterium]
MKNLLNIISLPLVLSVVLIITVYLKFGINISFPVILMIYLSLSLIVFILSLLFHKEMVYLSIIIIWIVLLLFFLKLKNIYSDYDYFNEMLKDNCGLIGEVKSFSVIHCAKIQTVVSVIGVKKTDITDYIKAIKKFKILIKINDLSCPVDKGDIIIINKRFILPPIKVFNYNYRENLFYKNIYGTINLQPDDLEITEKKINKSVINDFLHNTIWKIRKNTIDLFRNNLAHDNFSFVQAIFFGIRSEIDKKTSRQFSNTGMMHLLAMSGLHIGFIGLLFFKISNLLLSRSKSLVLSIIFLSAYFLMISESASSMRAFCMYSITAMFFIFGLSSAGITILSLSAVVLLFYNPFFVFDLGFRLSYFAAAGIILFHNNIFEKLPEKLPKKVKDLISVTISAFLSIFIMQWSVFNNIPFFSVISSILIVPFFSLVFITLFFLIIFNILFGFDFIYMIIDFICSMFLKLISFLDLIPSVIMPDIPEYFSILFFVFLIIYFYLLDPLIKKWIIYLRIKYF